MKHTKEQENRKAGQEAPMSREIDAEPAGGISHGLLPRLKGTHSLNGMRRNRFPGKAHGGFKDKELRAALSSVRVNNS